MVSVAFTSELSPFVSMVSVAFTSELSLFVSTASVTFTAELSSLVSVAFADSTASACTESIFGCFVCSTVLVLATVVLVED